MAVRICSDATRNNPILFVMCKFRTLNPDEVELRVAQAGKSKDRVWAQYLIYKDARVDQKILDETVTPMRWKKDYMMLDGKLYCSVSIWDNDLKEWVSKQDVGTESNTEKVKGEASDAFKRACFCWGIGRELYSAPDIFIELQNGEYNEKDGKVYPKNNLFTVQTLDIDEETRKITSLVIIDRNFDVRFSYPQNAVKSEKKKPAIKTANVERVHPTESQLKSMAKRIANGENLTDKIQVNFLMSQREWLYLDELIKNETQNK